LDGCGECFFTPSGVPAEEMIQNVRQKLIAEALKDDGNVPESYEKICPAGTSDNSPAVHSRDRIYINSFSVRNRIP